MIPALEKQIQRLRVPNPPVEKLIQRIPVGFAN